MRGAEAFSSAGDPEVSLVSLNSQYISASAASAAAAAAAAAATADFENESDFWWRKNYL